MPTNLVVTFMGGSPFTTVQLIAELDKDRPIFFYAWDPDPRMTKLQGEAVSMKPWAPKCNDTMQDFPANPGISTSVLIRY